MRKESRAGRRGRDEKITRIKMCYIHEVTPHNEHDYHILQTCSNKIKLLEF